MGYSDSKIVGIIPARFESTRFPGKPLALLGEKSIIQRVFEQASQCNRIDRIVIATDHQDIFDHVIRFGGEAVMTNPKHRSGTERCFEAFEKLKNKGYQADIIMNIQGDEPFINPDQIGQVAAMFENPEIKIATLVKKIGQEAELNSPHCVKVVRQVSGKAIYFSRAAIPFIRDPEQTHNLVFYKHIGLYGYRAETLRKLVRLPFGSLEKAESLEQLRWIENGFDIFTSETQTETTGIDTPMDLKRAEKALKQQEK